MRNLIFFICFVQICFAVYFMVSAQSISSDAAGRAMVTGYAGIFSMVVALTVLPALLLAIVKKWLPLGLVFSLITPAVVLAVYFME